MNNNNHKPIKLQFTRGIIKIDQLKDYIVPILDYPFADFIDQLYLIRQELDQQSGETKKDNYSMKRPWFSSFNELLQFLAPTLCHPFVQNYLEDSLQLPQSGEWLAHMPALGIPQKLEEPRLKPVTVGLLKQIMTFWVEVVVLGEQKYFSTEEKALEWVDIALKKTIASIQDATFVWDYVRLDELWGKRKQHAIGYRALHSLLAMQFVINSNKHPQLVDGENPDWRLAQEDTGLVPVSKCFQSNDGTFYAYTLNLVLRDIPGRSEPVIYMMPRLRRYMSSAIKWGGNDDVRVMIEYPSPILKQITQRSDIPQQQMPIRIRYGKYYRSYIVPMLERLIGNTGTNQALIDVKTLWDNPETFIKPHPQWHNASYHVIYDTGMDPKPTLEAGLPLEHIQTIHCMASSALADWMQAETSFPLIQDLIINSESIKSNEWLSLMNVKMISDSKGFKIWTERTPAKKRTENSPEKNHTNWLTAIQNRLRLAVNKRSIAIFLFADKNNALVAMEFDVRGVLAVLSMDGDLPEGFEIHKIKTPNTFLKELDEITPESWKSDVRSLQKTLNNLTNINGDKVILDRNKANIAIIQRPNKPSKKDQFARKQDAQKKSALRVAFGSSGIHSQMIRPFPDEDDNGLQVRMSNPWLKDRSRLFNAVTNALITSAGMSYGAPSLNYENLLGFESRIANNIVVEYWVRYRKTVKPGVDFIAVARQYANGYIEIVLPDSKTGEPLEPLSVQQASCYMQTLFAKGNEKDRIFTLYGDTPDNRVLIFFQAQLISRSQPTLIVPQVGDWRSRSTSWFHDESIQFNMVTIGQESYSASELENVRIVKMLADEKHNLRYWLKQELQDISNMKALIAVHDLLAKVPTIYSIDSRPEDGDGDRSVEKLEQRGRVVEFASLMMQSEDTYENQLSWCLIPHLSRIHPAWNKGSTIYPYPYHIVRSLVDDALWSVFEASRS